MTQRSLRRLTLALAIAAALAAWETGRARPAAAEVDFLPIEEEDDPIPPPPARAESADPWKAAPLGGFLDDGGSAGARLALGAAALGALLLIGLGVSVSQGRGQLERERAEALRRHEEEIAQFNQVLEGYKRSVEEKGAEVARSKRAVEEKAAELERANKQMAAMMADLQRGKADMEETNRQLTLSQMQLAEKAKRIREMSRVKSQFLANMSHELRTPMNAIIGFTEMVQKKAEGALPEVQMKNLERVRRNAHHLLGLINDILDLSKIESGKMDVDAESFGLRGLLVGVVQGLSPLASSKSIALEAEVEGEDAAMLSDPRKIRQIVTNLVSNALKFTDHGGVRVLARKLVCAVPAEGGGTRDREFVQIDVQDSGIGMRAEDLRLIFEEFRQVDGTSTRKHGGTGLGLAITQRLTELLGGTISVASEIGVGTTFSVRIPVVYEPPAEADAERARPAAAPAPSEPIQPLRPLVAAPPPERAAAPPPKAPAPPAPEPPPAPRHAPAALPPPEARAADAPPRAEPARARRVALVVNDDPDFVERAREALQEAGYQAMSAFDPAEGLEKASLIRPDLIVLDPMFADAAGWRMLPALKRDPAARRIPIVLAAAANGSGKGAAWRFRDFLLRPVRAEDVRAALGGGPMPKRVLVVEDDPAHRAALGETVRAWGGEAVFAPGPEAAARALGEGLPDLVLADLAMAERAGAALLARAEREDGLRAVPSIALLPEAWSEEAVAGLDRAARKLVAGAEDDVFARLGALAAEAAGTA